MNHTLWDSKEEMSSKEQEEALNVIDKFLRERNASQESITLSETELEFVMSTCKVKYANHGNDKKRKASYEEKDNANAGDRNDDPYAARFTPDFKKLRQDVFATLPQQPHFSPLAKYCDSVRQEMKLGFDMIFVKLTQKLQNFSGDEVLSHEEENAIRGELSNLEEMGYEVMKLRERFDLMMRVKTLAEEDGSYEEIRKKLDREISDLMVQLQKDQRRLFYLKSEKEVVQTKHCNFKSEMAILKAKLSKGDLCNTVKTEAKDQ